MEGGKRHAMFIALALWALSALLGSSALAEYTEIAGPSPSEASHSRILSGIYGGEFFGIGPDLGNGLFTMFTNGTVLAERVDDSGVGAALNIAVGAPGTGDDVLWTDGITTASAAARYARFPQEFGFDNGSGYTRLFDLSGSGFAVAGSGDIRFGMGATWMWARADGSNGGIVNAHYSLDSLNDDLLDHMVTYRVTGIPGLPAEQNVWLMFWEDLNGPLGDATAPDNRGFPADRDFNDLVVEVRALECLEHVDCTPGQLCDSPRGMCSTCLDDSDCPGEWLCDNVEGECRECLEDADCDDGDPGTIDTCAVGFCSHQPAHDCTLSSQTSVDTDLTLLIPSVDLRQDAAGPVTTKARFTVWNENEVRFSGTTRCVTCADQSLLSRYDFPNHFLVHNLQTDKGKVRIEGLASNLCDGSVDAPLLGIAVKEIRCNLNIVAMRTATNLIGVGTEPAQIRYDPLELPGELRDAVPNFGIDAIPLAEQTQSGVEGLGLESSTTRQERGLGEPGRTSVSQKGSLLLWPTVELKWAMDGQIIQDTFIELTNDFPADVLVHLFFVNGDPPLEPVSVGSPPVLVERGHPGWNHTDVQFVLTGDEPVFWSALTGMPKGVSPLTTLDPGQPPGRPDPDSDNSGDRLLRGFIVGWAIGAEGYEIRWNHLAGGATIVNYAESTAAEYPAWAFQCVSGVPTGVACDDTPGQLNMDGVEFDLCPGRLLLDFYATGSSALSLSLGP